MRKYGKLWKDEDIIILTSRHFSQKEFYNAMIVIGSSLYGLTDEQVLQSWFGDFKRDVNA